MSILAPIVLGIAVLTLGFRYNNWGLGLITLLLSGVFALLLSVSNLEEVKQNWGSRRCDLDVMLTANLYKPAEDSRTGSEFASENFTFCVRSILVTVISSMLSPILTLLNQQINVVEAVSETFNGLRGLQATFLRGFQSILSPIYKRFETTGNAFGITYQKLLMAMGRAFGITQAVLYIGMSLTVAIENFVHFVINVIMIVMYIILGLMVLLFFMFIPVFGIIIYTCQTIGNSSFGYLTEDVCGELCFDPTTKVRLDSGVIQTLADCKVGDVFEDGTRIEGILVAKGDGEPMFVLDGIRVTGAHLVWNEQANDWIATVHHPQAILSLQRSPRLICLRTSSRTIPLHGLTQTWKFRDWEELPSNLPSSDTIWDFLVSEILNEKPLGTAVPREHPMVRGDCPLLYKTGEVRTIAEVKIGDEIYGSQGFTKVTGVYRGEAKFAPGSLFTDGIWKKGTLESDWTHPKPQEGLPEQAPGFHLTTESGCFWIQTNDFSGFVRDFTEVGAHNLFLTYTYTRQLLKKSFCREESCVSASSSQASLSSLPRTF